MHGENYVPWLSRGKPLRVRSPEEVKQAILGAAEVKEVIAALVREKSAQYQGHLQMLPAEDQIYKDILREATKVIERIVSTYNHKVLVFLAQVMKKTFVSIYEKIVVNEQLLAKLRVMCDAQRPVVFCPTHRSYIDFLLLSLVLYYYKMEVPHICAGEDFLNIVFVNQLLRSSGAFFMRRTFKGDDLYKAIFKEYVTLLAQDGLNMEFFIEGTRSRTNKILPPKYGFISILTGAFFKGRVKDLTFIPVTINYTRTLEGETFPFELTGEEKVKESLGRIIKAIQIFSMNLGTIYLDFCDPITMSEYTAQKISQNPALKPYETEKDRISITNDLGLDIIYTMQKHVRMMPTILVASMLLLHRKGISEDELEKRVKWLGQDLQQRGIMLSTEGLPSTNTLKIGLTHLKDYLNRRRDIVEPAIVPFPKMDYKNVLMLGYYRNPLNHVYFNEGVVAVSMLSFADKQPWTDLSGIIADALYQRASFLANLLKREEVI